MVQLLTKHKILIAFGVIALFMVAAFALFFSVGNRVSAARLTEELQNVTGRKVVINGIVEIRVFPFLQAETGSISFSDFADVSDQLPVLSADSVRISLSMLAALRGEIGVTGIAFDKPVFRAKNNAGKWQLPFGAEARLAETLSEASATQNQSPKIQKELLETLRQDAFGNIQINDGTLILDYEKQDIIRNINGSISWPRGKKGGTIEGNALWRGEKAEFSFTSDEVALLLTGGDSGVGASIESAPVNARFSGQVRLNPAPFVEGLLFADVPSFEKMTKWQNLSVPFNLSDYGLSISTNLKGETGKWQFEDSKLQIGNNSGTGGLTLLPDLSPPLLSGTMDFETLDFNFLAQLFDPIPNTAQTYAQSGPASAAIPVVATDVRISARNATLGALSLAQVAASLQSSATVNALDIHNAAAFGGTLQIAMKRTQGTAPETELRILADNIETKALSALGEPFENLPQARGSLSAILHGPNGNDATFFDTASGTIKIRLGNGIVPGLNANQLVQALRDGGFTALKAEAPSVLTFNDIYAEATLSQGTLQFAPLRVGLHKATLELTGAYAVKEESIALTGALNLDAAHPEAQNGAESLTVFLGGNRKSPLMSSITATPVEK